ncbi:hypothetical protein [Candidatus Neptunochlamydia vexilliferae]|uniref:Secreted protein n=1 Tax=Candidatus Neptunichlamydia vexilliferae TaxID=1651774 RepID=A0ABS0AZY6_9BACT|nr:hypothetical protein [Candidatus Neptunochlamydia vexilliferae]MBF5059690.1 hypothetical protein [Candidatus Neptunochlamydia vexilliferae]
MKKLVSILTLLVATSSLAWANPQTESFANTQSEQAAPVENSYFHIGYDFNFSPFQAPEVGYRYQKDQLGLGASLAINGFINDCFYSKVAANIHFFPKPNASSQWFVGLDVPFSVVWTKETKSFWRFDPALFFGKDYSLAEGNKLFAQVYYVPGTLSLNEGDWTWASSLGFKIGYGF